jgi:hypothetical protein
MRQALEVSRLPRCQAPQLGWLGRLRVRLFGSNDQKRIIQLQHCSPHFLRDIGLLDDRRANDLLRDDVLFRR